MESTMEGYLKVALVAFAMLVALATGAAKNDPDIRAEGPCGSGASLAC